ncbi:hypothetical protein QE390_001684 [Siphonobacter sp. SORGH_AS 1065]|nr:hypothetical protein [Siphonobacter sp. SORGH_AS_1065]
MTIERTKRGPLTIKKADVTEKTIGYYPHFTLAFSLLSVSCEILR